MLLSPFSVSCGKIRSVLSCPIACPHDLINKLPCACIQLVVGCPVGLEFYLLVVLVGETVLLLYFGVVKRLLDGAISF